MTKVEETYLFFLQSIDILNDSLKILVELKSNETTPVLFNAAFRYALVEYSKPFGATNGLFKNAAGTKPVRIKYDLKRFILREKLELHQKIIDSRDQFHAHGDMSILDAKVYVQDGVDGKIVTVSKNLVHGCEEFQNVDDLIDMIESTLNNMEEELLSLKEALPQNCAFLQSV
jgi:hypothetical protein